jgi:hypothetical protein
VPHEFLHRISLIGRDDQVRSRLDAYAPAGVTCLTVTPAGATLDEQCSQIARLRELADPLPEVSGAAGGAV